MISLNLVLQHRLGLRQGFVEHLQHIGGFFTLLAGKLPCEQTIL